MEETNPNCRTAEFLRAVLASSGETSESTQFLDWSRERWDFEKKIK